MCCFHIYNEQFMAGHHFLQMSDRRRQSDWWTFTPRNMFSSNDTRERESPSTTSSYCRIVIQNVVSHRFSQLCSVHSWVADEGCPGSSSHISTLQWNFQMTTISFFSTERETTCEPSFQSEGQTGRNPSVSLMAPYSLYSALLLARAHMSLGKGNVPS